MRGNNYFIFFSLILFSCGVKKLPPIEYVNWVKDYSNGLHKKKEIDNYIFDIQFKPYDFIIINEQNGRMDGSDYKKRLSEIDGFDYFTLKISKKGGDVLKDKSTTTKDLNARQNYFSFNFRNDIYIMDGLVKIPCTLYHFERSYDLASAKTFVLGFNKIKDSKSDKTLVIDSREIGLGVVKINFDQKDFKNIPEIKL